MRLLLIIIVVLAAAAVNAQPRSSIIYDALDRRSDRIPPYDPDRPPGQLLHGDISSRLDPAKVIEVARGVFAGRNWQIGGESDGSFVAQYGRRDIVAKVQVFFAGNALRYIDDSMIGDQRAMAPTAWMNNVRTDLRLALATMTVREESRPVRRVNPPQGGDVAERLRTLKALLDAGMITPAEYDAKRTEILRDL